MIIRIKGKPISTNTASAIGVALVDCAASFDRCNVQEAQARIHPRNRREQDEAARAHARAVSAMHRLQDLITEATA